MRLRTPVGSIDSAGRMLEDARAVAFGGGRKRQRVIERMDGDRLQVIDGVKIAFAAQHRAHPLGRPALDLAAQLAEHSDIADEFIVVVFFGNVEPTILRVGTGRVFGTNCGAHIIEAGLRQRPQILGAFEPNTRDQLVGVGAEPRQHETGIAA